MPKVRSSSTPFSFPYLTCRNISAPEDDRADRKVYAGHAPATSFLELEDNENLREYLVDAEGKQKRSPTLVHQAIRKTLKETIENFSILNGGICLIARGAEIDERKKTMMLDCPSIINGSQTQGELRRYFKSVTPDQDGYFVPSVTYELIITTDDELIAEISIARNFQNDVRPISIAGRRGQLDELETAIRKRFPKFKLRKSETDLSDEYIDTEKLVQVLFVLSPTELWEEIDKSPDLKNKAFTYSQKTRCLKLFQKVVENQDQPPYKELYRFLLDVAPAAWELYERWKKHSGFYGTRLKSIQRSETGEVVEVPDGIIFPILGSFSAFAAHQKSGWRIEVPPSFDEKILIQVAAQDYQEIAGHNPQTMGKSRACYSSLYRITSIYADLLKPAH
jgi:hypothetical protein